MSEINVRIGHLDHLESPWGNAGGTIKTVEDVEKMAGTGVGWGEAGSFCLERRYGNQKDENGKLKIDEATGEPIKVYHFDPITGEAFNSLGMPGPGIDQVEKEIPEMVKIAEANKIKLIVNVAPVTNKPVEETKELVERSFGAGAHAVLVNGGCPNVIVGDGKRHEVLSRNAHMTYMVLSGLRAVTEKYNKVFFRVSPQPSYDQAKTVYRNIERAGTVSAIWLPNSWGGSKPVDKKGQPILGVSGGIGGRTGPATAKDALTQLNWAVKIFNGSKIQSVLSGGIMDSEPLKIRAAETLKTALALGAVAAAGTTFYYEPREGWKEDTSRLLHDLAKTY